MLARMKHFLALTNGGANMKDERLYIRIDLETKNKLKERAEKEGRTVSNYIQRLISLDLIRKREVNNMLIALKKLYEELGYEDPDIISDIEHDFLSNATCRNGKEVLWYMDDSKCMAMYIDTLEFLSEEEIEKELC